MTHQRDTRTPTPVNEWKPFTPGYSDLSPEQLRFLVERAHELRSAYIANALKRWFREWRSVFRRPARMLPRGGGGAQPQTH